MRYLSLFFLTIFLLSCADKEPNDKKESIQNENKSYTSETDSSELPIFSKNANTELNNDQNGEYKNILFDYSDVEFIKGVPNVTITAEFIRDGDRVINDRTQYEKKEIKIDFEKDVVLLSTSKSSEGIYPKFHSKVIEVVNIIDVSSAKKGVVKLIVKNVESDTYIIGKELIIDFNKGEIQWLNHKSGNAVYTWSEFTYSKIEEQNKQIVELLVYNGYRAGSNGLQQDKVILTSDLMIKHLIIDWDSKFTESIERVEAEYYPINYEIVKDNNIIGILVKCATTKNNAVKNKAIYIINFSLKKDAIIYMNPSHDYSVGEISNIHLHTYPTNKNFEGKGFVLNNLSETSIQFTVY